MKEMLTARMKLKYKREASRESCRPDDYDANYHSGRCSNNSFGVWQFWPIFMLFHSQYYFLDSQALRTWGGGMGASFNGLICWILSPTVVVICSGCQKSSLREHPQKQHTVIPWNKKSWSSKRGCCRAKPGVFITGIGALWNKNSRYTNSFIRQMIVRDGTFPKSQKTKSITMKANEVD